MGRARDETNVRRSAARHKTIGEGMRRMTIALALLALAAGDAVAQGMTTTRRIRGDDARGKFDIGWVRLTERFPDAAVRARVNRDLEREARSHMCRAGDGRHLEAEFSMEVSYRSSRLLGVSTVEFVYCGGAYPTHGTRGLMYDLRTGRRIEVEAEMADSAAYRRFRDARVEAARPADAEDCPHAGESWSYIYILKPGNLSVTQDFPNMIQACAYETLIPHADLIRYLKPASPLRALAVRRRR
jgi:hypothetical protein